MAWVCEAYGPEGVSFGAVCFFAGTGERSCCSESVCRDRLASERQRVFRLVNELAASGDPVWAEVADEFGSPSDLLGGRDA